MTLTHDEIMSRTDEMFKLLETVNQYTQKYGRPSLSDIAVFETMLEQFENLEMNDKVAHCDIYRAWADYLEHDQFFTLQYGWEQQEEEVLDFLEAKGIITYPEDCDNCGETMYTDSHECEEGEE